MSEHNEGSSERLGEKSGTGFFNVLKSVMSAAFGVQSKGNRERDFVHGKPLHFIVGGLLGTLLFIGVIILVVRLLLAYG